MSLINNTTYCGKELEGFYSVALLTGKTKELIRLIPNIKSTAKLTSLNLGNILQADSCVFNASGAATLDQKTITVCALKVNVEFCEKDFETLYLSETMRPGSNVDGNLPPTFQEWILNKLIPEKISAETERLLWQGDTEGSPADLCDGLLKKMLADGDVIDVGGTTLSASNIIAQIGLVYDKIPDTIINTGKVVIFISPAAGKFYKQALVAANPALIAWNKGDFNLSYLDVPLVVSPGMTKNYMVAAEPMNLVYATDLVSDETEVQVLSMKDILGQPTVRFITEFKWGNQYCNGVEIVFYH